MTSITLPRSKSADGLAFYHTGEGLAVVLIHGVGLRSESWYQQIDALKNHFSVYAVDMPGHGESNLLSKKEPTISDFTEKMTKFILDEVKQPAVIVGHSMGALLSLSIAKEYPELCLGIIAMNTVYKRSEDAKQAVQLRAANLAKLSNADVCAPISRWFSDNLSDEDKFNAQLCRDWLSAANLDGYAAAYRIFALEDGPKTLNISKLKMPVLYITGELDKNSNISMTNALSKITPKAEAVIIEGSRHMTPLTHHEEVNQAMLSFLQRQVLQRETKNIA